MNQLKLFQIDNLQARPPLRYPGSKYGALKIIQKYLPIVNHCQSMAIRLNDDTIRKKQMLNALKCL